MTTRAQVISFVSGKGGVGKTTLAINYAWVCSQFGKTALIDLDLQNRGASSLFFRKIDQHRLGSADCLLHLGEVSELVSLAEQLWFMPAASANAPYDTALTVNALQSTVLTDRLNHFISTLSQDHGFEIVVLDCHGGVDYLSSAAKDCSDNCLVITEPDIAALGGTLELLSFYRRLAVMSETPKMQTASVSLVVNQVPGQYEWSKLNNAYQEALTEYSNKFGLSNEVMAFVPLDDTIRDGFGISAIQAKLVPASIFAKKVRLLCYKTLSWERFTISKYKAVARLRNSWLRERIESSLSTSERKSTTTLLYGFSALMFYITAGLSLLSAAAFYYIRHRKPEEILSAMMDFALQPAKTLHLLIIVGWCELPVMLLGVIGVFGLLRYFWNDLKFKLLVRSDQDLKFSTGENLAILKGLALVMSCSFSMIVMLYGLFSVSYVQLHLLRTPPPAAGF